MQVPNLHTMVDAQEFFKVLNGTGLVLSFAGGFFLSVEALRLSKYSHTIYGLQHFLPRVLRRSLWLQVVSAVLSAILFGAGLFVVNIWINPGTVWATVSSAPASLWWSLIIMAVGPPALFFVLFLLNTILKWSIKHSGDGLAALIGFVLLTLGTTIQFIALVLT